MRRRSAETMLTTVNAGQPWPVAFIRKIHTSPKTNRQVSSKCDLSELNRSFLKMRLVGVLLFQSTFLCQLNLLIPLLFCCCFVYFLQLYCLNGIFPMGNSAAFPVESQLRQGRTTQPTVHAGCLSVSIIHRTLTWTTGSLTCTHM